MTLAMFATSVIILEILSVERYITLILAFVMGQGQEQIMLIRKTIDDFVFDYKVNVCHMF